jgi:hypothetical protein
LTRVPASSLTKVDRQVLQAVPDEGLRTDLDHEPQHRLGIRTDVEPERPFPEPHEVADGRALVGVQSGDHPLPAPGQLQGTVCRNVQDRSIGWPYGQPEQR